MKKFLLLTSGVFFSFGANAQASKFEGASANVALAYQSYSSTSVPVVSISGSKLSALSSASKGLVGKIGLDYTWRLSEKNFLAIGFDYAANYSGNVQVSYVYQGAVLSTDQSKIKQKVKVFIAPSRLINPDTLGYFKLGYAQYHGRLALTGTKPPSRAVTLGLGVKFMPSENDYFFVEANMLSGRPTTYTSPFNGAVSTTKPKGSEILVGYGVKF